MLHAAPTVRRRPPRGSGRTGVAREALVPAGVPGETEVGRGRRGRRGRLLVEEEVGEGDLPLLPVLRHGPVDERDEALHDTLCFRSRELKKTVERGSSGYWDNT